MIDVEQEAVVIKPKDGFGGIGGDYVLPTALATHVNAFYRRCPEKQIIGCGGVKTGEHVFMHLLAGASLVQVGTALYEEGPRRAPERRTHRSARAQGLPAGRRARQTAHALSGVPRTALPARLRLCCVLPHREHTAMIDLFYAPTPNGHKITILFEELGLPYRIVPINIRKGDQFLDEFLAIAPNNRIPAIEDRDWPDGPLRLMESGAILTLYAERNGRFLPAEEGWRAPRCCNG